jgi:hypothetical protein
VQVPVGPRTAALAIAAIVVVGVVELLFDAIATAAEGRFADLPFYLVFIAPPASLGAVGLLLAVRRHENVIGWLLLVAAALTAVTFGAGDYVRTNGPGAPFATAAGWAGSSFFIPAVGILVVFVPLLFPTGRLPSRRWGIVAIAAAAASAAGALASATTPGPMIVEDGPLNPLVPPAPVADWIRTVGAIGSAAAAPLFLLAVTSLLLRFRRSSGVERQQLKWFLFAASVTALAIASSTLLTGPLSDTLWLVGIAALAFLPIAIGLAILRYRLYDIDRIVSRAVGYSLVTAVLGGLFAGFVLLSQEIAAPFLGSDTIGVAVSTLVVASSFQPVRRAIQARVDQRFDRTRVDADRLVVAFGRGLRDQTDLPTITAELVDVVRETVAPERAGLWLSPRHGRGGSSGDAAPSPAP